MARRVSWRRRLVTVGLATGVLAGLAAVPAVASASGQPGAWWRAACERQLDAAAERDMQAFATFRAAQWRDLHHPDAVSVFASGHVFVGIDAIMAALAGHFTNQNATWEYRELDRVVAGCKSAYVLYETTYAVPSTGFVSHALTGVSWTRERGRWLVIGDQGTAVSG